MINAIRKPSLSKQIKGFSQVETFRLKIFLYISLSPFVPWTITYVVQERQIWRCRLAAVAVARDDRYWGDRRGLKVVVETGSGRTVPSLHTAAHLGCLKIKFIKKLRRQTIFSILIKDFTFYEHACNMYILASYIDVIFSRKLNCFFLTRETFSSIKH